jgi:hypothetical protein
MLVYITWASLSTYSNPPSGVRDCISTVTILPIKSVSSADLGIFGKKKPYVIGSSPDSLPTLIGIGSSEKESEKRLNMNFGE